VGKLSKIPRLHIDPVDMETRTKSLVHAGKPLLLDGVYRASKAAVNAFTESLAAEVGVFGVRLHIILPGRSPEIQFGANARHICAVSMSRIHTDHPTFRGESTG
jgi:NAD(P)-dependent dehydrogenase (short-subunit alcohol dehydrogenase family)